MPGLRDIVLVAEIKVRQSQNLDERILKGFGLKASARFVKVDDFCGL